MHCQDLACADRESNLKAAVDNYNQALTVLTKDKLPGDWKKTQGNLEIALDALRQRGG